MNRVISSGDNYATIGNITFQGLFDTLFHVKQGILAAPPDNGTVFDIHPEDSVTTLHDKWNDGFRLKSGGDFIPIHSSIVLGTIVVLYVVHLLISWALIKKLYYNARVGWTKKLLESLWTVVCTPIDLDWDLGGDSTA